jgi:hypothetical protein
VKKYFVKKFLNFFKHLELCESLLKKDEIMNIILSSILKNNLLDSFIQICKIKNLSLIKNEQFLIVAKKLKKKNEYIDSRKIQEIDFLINHLN